MPVEFGKDGRLKLSALNHNELCAIDAFLDHARDGIRSQLRHAKAASAFNQRLTSFDKQEQYAKHVERFIVWCVNQLSQTANWTGKENPDADTLGRHTGEQTVS